MRGYDCAVISHDDVRRIAQSLPDAYEQPSFGGRPSWRTTPRMFAWIREDPEALVVWVSSQEEKAAMIASDPSRFLTTAHYDGKPILLVSLEAVDVKEASELMTESWRLRAPRPLVKSWDAAH